MSHVKESILHFPCDYVIKIEGKNRREFKSKVCEVVEQHTGKLDTHQITTKYKDRMASMTIRIVATSRAQINAINKDLINCQQLNLAYTL
jgi:putative lipoic acid-binding regulatory protein